MKIFFTLKKEYLAIIVFALLIAIFYGNTLNNDFAHDDIGQIVDNQYIHSMEYLPKVITGCIWESAMGGCKDRTDYYRPFQNLSYLLTYQISSEPWIFHLVNLFYFFIVVYLVFALVKTITNNFLLSFVSALVFLINPINNEVVNWISAVPELVSGIFILLSTIFYIKFRKTSSNVKFFAACIFYFLGMMAKEPAAFLPIIFVFIDWMFFDVKIVDFKILNLQNSKKKNIKEKAKLSEKKINSDKIGREIVLNINFKELKKYIILAGLFFAYLLTRITIIGGLSGGYRFYGDFSIHERIYSFFTLFAKYITKVFSPYPLNFFYKFQKNSDFLGLEFLFSFIIIFVFVFALYILIKKREKLLSLAFVWFFVFISPVLIFLEALGENIFSERYLFIPVIGFSFAVSFVFVHFWKDKKAPKQLLILLAIVVIITSWGIAYSRNNAWKNSITIYQTTLAQNPDARPLRFNLGVLYNQNGNPEDARKEWEEIEKRNKDWLEISSVYNSLGNYYREKGNPEKTIEYYQKAADASHLSGNINGFSNLGITYFEKGEYLRSLTYFCKAIKINPEVMSVKNKLDLISFMLESLDEEDLPGLYEDFTSTEVFKKSADQKFLYKGKRCNKEICSYLVLSNTDENEIIFPFLIMARTPFGEMIKIIDTQFNPGSREIIISVDSKHKEKPMTFIFPSCEGIYYETEIFAEKNFISEEMAP